MQLPIRIKRDGVDEWVLIEMQGSLECTHNTPFSGRQLGDLTFNKDGCPILVIGHHALVGKEVKLEKPFALMVREGERGTTTQFTVQAIISHKLIFKNRPKPIVSHVPKKI